MSSPQSVSRRLNRGLGWVGLFGGFVLIVFVSFDVDLMLEQQSAEVGWHGKWLEIAEHVVLPLIVLIVPMFIAARWVIRTSLAPLDAAAARIDATAGTERGVRLDVEGLPAEVQPFAQAINSLLERRDDAAVRNEAFVASAAHEIRTPLAILMFDLEKLGTPSAIRLKKDVAAMDRLVGQIMLMAQVDAYAEAPIARASVSLEKIATDVAARFASIAIAQGKHIELRAESQPVVTGVEEMLVAAVSNLVDNGLRVTPAGGTVIISVGPGTRIAVQDGGPGLSVEELERLSQRFVRGENASAGGAGLGLAIVAQAMDIHWAELTTNPHLREISLEFSVDYAASQQE